jgi:C-terminal processing protease CtpA/Prc
VELTAAVLSLCTAPAAAQSARLPMDTPRATHDSIQIWRDRAGARIARGDTTGLADLRALLDTLHSSQQMEAMAAGYMYLGNRDANIRFDLLEAYLDLGRHSDAINEIEEMVDLGPLSSFRPLLRRADSVLADSSRYGRARQAFDRSAVLFTNRALRAGDADSLTQAHRVAGLSVVWSTAREFYPEILSIPAGNWDSLYLAALPEIAQETDPFRYYRRLQRFVAGLGDAHSNVFPPEAMGDSLLRNVALETGLVDSQVVILTSPPQALAERGFARGQEIIAVDGVPVHDYARERIAPFVSSSTPQDRTVRVYSYELLRGPRGDSVRLDLREPQGGVRRLWAPRAIRPDPRPAVIARRLAEFGYLNLRTFDVGDPRRLKARFDSLADGLGPVEGWVLDLRENGGGSSTTGWQLLAEFLQTPILRVMVSRSRRNDGTSRSRGEELAFGPVFDNTSIVPDSQRRRRGPVVLLVGPRTFSAAEDFVLAFQEAGLGPLIGEKTGGSTGQPLGLALPGGATGRIRVKDDRYIDGRRFVNIGIEPDILVETRLVDLRAGRDAALERAIAWLRGYR